MRGQHVPHGEETLQPNPAATRRCPRCSGGRRWRHGAQPALLPPLPPPWPRPPLGLRSGTGRVGPGARQSRAPARRPVAPPRPAPPGPAPWQRPPPPRPGGGGAGSRGSGSALETDKGKVGERETRERCRGAHGTRTEPMKEMELVGVSERTGSGCPGVPPPSLPARELNHAQEDW